MPDGRFKIILVDIDGTLTIADTKLFKSYAPENEAENHIIMERSVPRWPVIRMVNALHPAYRVILLTARPDRFRTVTRNWLLERGVKFDGLWMRTKEEEAAHDVDVKRRFLEMIYRMFGTDSVELIIEDRQVVVDMWRALGLTCLQVAPGNY